MIIYDPNALCYYSFGFLPFHDERDAIEGQLFITYIHYKFLCDWLLDT